MAYELRDRRPVIYREGSSSDSESESESDSAYYDPDYSNRPVSRQQRQQEEHIDNVGVSDDPSMNAATGVVRRRPGRPPRNAASTSAQNQVPNGQIPQRRKRKRRAPFSLRKPNSNKALQRYQDKRTMMALLIDTNKCKENQEVYYWDNSKKKITLQGEITRAGILCKCCANVVTASEFEVHAQSGFRGEPYRHIVLGVDNGSNLLECQFMAWYDGIQLAGRSLLDTGNFEPEDNALDKSDDACIVCADGGDLICCEKCPSTFHVSCLSMETIPQGEWLCPNCVCKHCGLSDGDVQEISKCTLCEKTYHLACYEQKELNLNAVSPKFCGQSCEEVHDKLKKMEGGKNELDGGFSWTLLHHRQPLSDKNDENFYQVIQHNCKIAVAWTMMNESFNTIIDRHTKINVVQNVIYNTSSNLPRIDFKGFYTAVLEKDEEVICAASLRFHGTKMAEMPFVATHKRYRKKGMLSKLLVGIESALCYLSVKNLVVPSSENVVAMWIKKFYFSPIAKFLEEDVVHSNMLMFTKAVKLYKNLVSNVAVTKIHQVADNDTKEMVPESSTKGKPIFDMNLLPPKKDEDEGAMRAV